MDFDELTTPQINTKQKSGIIKSNYHQKQFNFIHRDVNSYLIKDEQKTVLVKRINPQALIPSKGTIGYPLDSMWHQRRPQPYNQVKQSQSQLDWQQHSHQTCIFA